MRYFIVSFLVASITACQWVKPTDAGHQVSLVKLAHIMNCEKLGATTSKVKARVGLVRRKEREVVDDLVILAKNEAAQIGGDTIIAEGKLNEGQQTFDIYRCL